MKFGVLLFPLDAEGVASVSRSAEQFGLDSVWIGDRLISPRQLRHAIPYSPARGGKPFDESMPYLDPFVTLGLVSGICPMLKLFLSVAIVPLYDVFRLARAVATLDLLSEGRFTLGVGVGWMEEEFLISRRTYADRGQRLIESLSFMEQLWNCDEVQVDSPESDGLVVRLEPKPRSRPHPPYMFGGHSNAALRRAAKLGSAWAAIDLPPERMARHVRDLQQYRERLYPEAEPVEVSMLWGVPQDAAQAAALIAEYHESGVDRLVIRLKGPQRANAEREMERVVDIFAAARETHGRPSR